MNIEKLKNLGVEWSRGEINRIYFNDLHKLYGLEIKFLGNRVISANINGKTISNYKARGIFLHFRFAKIWYDLNENKFDGKEINKKMFNKIIKKIKELTS